ncbi:2-hydroxyacid dehydrogenase [Diaporthe amygdali]|uniref:2-hydroxyacid dehydrogenase n=1 Tax=Phomopsis amygdali TaxID=1214568 RepID=UPI0022FE820D|nr:2-hydroxyacid dehydrogenase [Diaporthe amygdali]KAJ0107465.1 2-hydroxyacid dehydrogenase [Diaporthe amygdali]
MVSRPPDAGGFCGLPRTEKFCYRLIEAFGQHTDFSMAHVAMFEAQRLRQRREGMPATECPGPGTRDQEDLILFKRFHSKSSFRVNDLLRQDLDILVMCMVLTSEAYEYISCEHFKTLSQGKG